MSASGLQDRGTTGVRSRPWFAAQTARTLPPFADMLAPVRSCCRKPEQSTRCSRAMGSDFKADATVPLPLPQYWRQRPGVGGYDPEDDDLTYL